MPGITNPAEEYFKDGLWGWVTTAWKKLVATAGGALHIQFAGQEADVEVTQTAAADLTPGVCGWIGSAWQKLPMVWGYSEHWEEDLGGSKDGNGTYQADTVAVPAGYVYRLDRLIYRNETGERGDLVFYLYHGTDYWHMLTPITPARYQVVSLVGPLTLAQGNVIRVLQLSCLHGDVIRAVAVGYKMKIAE